MREIKSEIKHFLETQILGAYETAEVIWQGDSEGNLKRTFADSFVYRDENHYTIERNMDVEGKNFRVHSVFPVTAKSTPTKKMLTIIDSNLTK